MPFIFPLANQHKPLGRAFVQFSRDDEAPGNFEPWPEDQFEITRASRAFGQLRYQSSSLGNFWWLPVEQPGLPSREQSGRWFGASADFATFLAMLHADCSFRMSRPQVWASGELPSKGSSLELIEISHLRHKVEHFLHVSEENEELSLSVFFLPRSQINGLLRVPSLKEDARASWMEWPPDEEQIRAALFQPRVRRCWLFRLLLSFYKNDEKPDSPANTNAIIVGVENSQLDRFVHWLEECSLLYEELEEEEPKPPTPGGSLRWFLLLAVSLLLVALGSSCHMGLCDGLGRAAQPAVSLFYRGEHDLQSATVYRCGLLCTNRCDLQARFVSQKQGDECRSACHLNTLSLRCRFFRTDRSKPPLSEKQWLLRHHKVCHLIDLGKSHSPMKNVRHLADWHEAHCSHFASKYDFKQQGKIRRSFQKLCGLSMLH